MSDPRDSRSTVATIVGAALIVFGGWWLLRNLIPSAIYDLANRLLGGVVLIVIGVIVLLIARRGSFAGPRTGARLYRARSDRWIGGVLGGLGAYLGIDPLILRIVVILLALLGQGGVVLAYIVAWVLIPEEPVQAPGVAAPSPAVPSAPPEAPTSAEPPAPDAGD